MIRKNLWVRVGGASGVSLVVVYILATVLGTILRPDYSNIRDSASELTETGAPNKVIFDLMFGSHHLMLIIFAVGFYFSLSCNTKRWIGPILLGLAVLVGIVLTVLFPCDVGCEANPTTFWGKGHGVLVGISALLVFLGLLALSWSMRKNTNWEQFAKYTLISAIFTLILAAASISLLDTQYTGFGERIALVPLFLWFVLAGYRLWNISYLR